MQIGISEQDMALETGLTEEYYRRLEQENQSVPQKGTQAAERRAHSSAP